MRYRLVPVLALLLLLPVACGTAEQPTPAEDAAPEPEEMPVDETAALDEIRSMYQSAYNAGDAATIAGMFADDAWYLPADGSANQGTAEIQAALESAMSTGGTVTITTGDARVMGDWAMTRGGWSMSMTPEGGEAMTVGGHYVTAFRNVAGEWRISTLLTNYDAAPPELMPAAEAPAERLPAMENSPVAPLTTQYMEMYNAGNGSGVAGLYTADAVAAFADAPLATGQQAITEYMVASMAELGSPKLTIHTVGAQDLGSGYHAAGGWYRIASESGDREGHWMTLVMTDAEGNQRIVWGITNALH